MTFFLPERKDITRAIAILLLVINSMVSEAQSINTPERSVTLLTDGVYFIRHKDSPDGFPQSNTTVIIGEREVLVVDACYLPSSAAEDIEQIKKWTNKPVRYLVNTHWHYDHTMGNGVYAQAFPGIGIVAHEQTQKHIKGYNPGWFERFPKRGEVLKQYADSGKDANGNPLSEDDIKVYREYVKGIQPVHEEYKKLTDFPPNLSFSESFNVDLGNREVQIKHLGKGNTSGDAVIYLPKEKILIAGDLLDHPVPYLGGGFPSQLSNTLKRMADFDAEIILPGHGDVLRGTQARDYLQLVTDFVTEVTAEVHKQIYLLGSGPRNLDKVRAAVEKNIDVASWRKKFAGDDKDNASFFDGFSMQGIVTAAYAEAWGK